MAHMSWRWRHDTQALGNTGSEMGRVARPFNCQNYNCCGCPALRGFCEGRVSRFAETQGIFFALTPLDLETRSLPSPHSPSRDRSRREDSGDNCSSAIAPETSPIHVFVHFRGRFPPTRNSIVHARSLRPLVKTRAFGMTPGMGTHRESPRSRPQQSGTAGAFVQTRRGRDLGLALCPATAAVDSTSW